MGGAISRTSTNARDALHRAQNNAGAARTTAAAGPATDSPVITRFVPRWRGIGRRRAPANGPAAAPAAVRNVAYPDENAPAAANRPPAAPVVAAPPTPVVPMLPPRMPRANSFAKDNELAVATGAKHAHAHAHAHAHVHATPRREEREKKPVFVDYTPMGAEKEDYKFYCQFCCMYFREILQSSSCCKNYVCYSCALAYCGGRCGLKSDLAGIPRDLPAEMPCIACSTQGMQLAYVSFHEKVRSYADSPATRKAMADAEKARLRAEQGLPTIEGSPNQNAKAEEGEGDVLPASGESTPGKALAFDAIVVDDGLEKGSPTGVDDGGIGSNSTSASTSAANSPPPVENDDGTGPSIGALVNEFVVGATVTVPTPRQPGHEHAFTFSGAPTPGGPLTLGAPTPGRLGGDGDDAFGAGGLATSTASASALMLNFPAAHDDVSPRAGEFHAFARGFVDDAMSRFVRVV